MSDLIVNSSAKEADVVLLGAGYDLTSSYGTGSRTAPSHIVKVLDEQIERYDRVSKTTPHQFLKIGYFSIDEIHGKRPADMVETVGNMFSRLYSQGKFIITLGGEHSVTNGPLEAIARAMDPEKITVVQIDAHFDLRDDDSDYNEEPWGKFAHSTVMRRAFERGFKILPIGIRAYSKEFELDFAKKHNIPFFEWGLDEEPRIYEITEKIKTDKVYLTVDVDGFDPAVFPSTGTPVAGGLSWRYGLGFIKKLFDEKDVIAADVVEVIPTRAPDLTTFSAASLVYSMIGLKMEDCLKGRR